MASRRRRSPNWINSTVILEALAKRKQGLLNYQLNAWIEQLLELEPQETSLADHNNE